MHYRSVLWHYEVKLRSLIIKQRDISYFDSESQKTCKRLAVQKDNVSGSELQVPLRNISNDIAYQLLPAQAKRINQCRITIGSQRLLITKWLRADRVPQC